jgi:hypothetical protein
MSGGAAGVVLPMEHLSSIICKMTFFIIFAKCTIFAVVMYRIVLLCIHIFCCVAHCTFI